MIKVVLADDEEFVLQGISQMVPWQQIGLQLIATAEDGHEALEKIREHKPQIVITDIRMPGLDGLGLIEKCQDLVPKIEFIVISGFDEFDFAKGAMKFGVQHYLLKPTDEKELVQVLKKVIAKITTVQEREMFHLQLEETVRKMKPLVKRQFLHDLALGYLSNKQEIDYYQNIFHLTGGRIQIILFQPERSFGYDELLAIEKLCNFNLKKIKPFMTTFIKNRVMVLTGLQDTNCLKKRLALIQDKYKKYCKKKLSIAISSEGSFGQLAVLYQEVCEYLALVYYTGVDQIITSGSSRKTVIKNENKIGHGLEQVKQAIKFGGSQDVEKALTQWFADLELLTVKHKDILTYIFELFLPLFRSLEAEEAKYYLSQLIHLEGVNTLHKVRGMVGQIAAQINESIRYKHGKIYKHLIQSVLMVIDQNITNSELSLKWIAQNKVYANIDYLSKLFKREVGCKFSKYIREKRLAKARALLKDTNKSINEIARLSGFGYNSQYFCKVFKKRFGAPPKIYKREVLG